MLPNAVSCSIWTPRSVWHDKCQKSANKAVLGQEMHRFQVKTPIWQVVPVSRAYPPPSSPEKCLLGGNHEKWVDGGGIHFSLDLRAHFWKSAPKLCGVSHEDQPVDQPVANRFGRAWHSVCVCELKDLAGISTPPKKKLANPPQIPRSYPPGLSPPALSPLPPNPPGVPPPGIFNKNRTSTPSWRLGLPFPRRRTNVQQLTCNIGLSCSVYYIFFFFVLLELNPLFWRGKSRGKNYEKLWNCEKVWKLLKRFCPLVVAL